MMYINSQQNIQIKDNRKFNIKKKSIIIIYEKH